MIVADTSALISLATAQSLDVVLDEFDVHTTATVLDELGETADYDDSAGEAADIVLDQRDCFTVHAIEEDVVTSSRIDPGEGSCSMLANQLGAVFLITDDVRALPELQNLTEATVAISPIILKALVKRDVLDGDEAEDRVDRLADERGWIDAPIYRRAKRLFEDGDE